MQITCDDVYHSFDSYGDGICCEFGEGFYNLSSDSGDVIFDGGEFGGSEITEISTDEASVDFIETALSALILTQSCRRNNEHRFPEIRGTHLYF